MTFELNQLPQNLLFQVLRHMENQSLCRTRRTCKTIDKFAEYNRFKIATRREDTNWTLLVEKKSENADALYYSIRNNFIDYGEGEWEFGTPEEDEQNDDAVLTDPYAQLSAVSIQAVLLFSTNCMPDCRHLRGNLPDFLSRLQLRVEWLCLFCYFTPELQASVDFLRLRIETDIFNSFKERREAIIPMGIQKCKEIALRDSIFYFSSCKPLFSITKVFSIELFNRKECAEFIQQLITTVQDDENGLGVLKLFRISYQFLDNKKGKFKFIDVDPLHCIEVTDKHYMEFYRIPIYGGFVIIAHVVTYVEFHFVEDDSRETLLNALWTYLSENPPLDDEVEDFAAAHSEKEAIDEFYESTLGLMHFVELGKKPTLKSETLHLKPLQ